MRQNSVLPRGILLNSVNRLEQCDCNLSRFMHWASERNSWNEIAERQQCFSRLLCSIPTNARSRWPRIRLPSMAAQLAADSPSFWAPNCLLAHGGFRIEPMISFGLPGARVAIKKGSRPVTRAWSPWHGLPCRGRGRLALRDQPRRS